MINVLFLIVKLCFLIMYEHLFTDLIVRNFKGHDSLREVECSGKGLNQDVDLLSLSIINKSNGKVFSTLLVFKNACFVTYAFSSCIIDTQNTHLSRLKLLISAPLDGKNLMLVCECNVINLQGKTKAFSWTLIVRKVSE